MKKTNILLFILFVSFMALVVNAEASVFTDGGYTTFSTTDWTADVYWKVYEPYTYDGNLSEYLYAYLIYNYETSELSLTQLTIDNPFELNITDIGYDDLEGTVAPSSMVYGLSGAIYGFTNPMIQNDQASYILWFTSPGGPGWVSAELSSPGPDAYNNVPGPVPEPASLLLLGIGVFGFGLLKKIRR